MESVTEEAENDFISETPSINMASKTNITPKTNINNKNINLKLTPLDLKEDHIEVPKNQQKLTTPGKIKLFAYTFHFCMV